MRKHDARHFEVLGIERLPATPATETEQPTPAETPRAEPPAKPVAETPAEPAAEPFAEPPAPPPKRRSYEVPDLEMRVDAALRQRLRARRALPVPQFTPLPREPWEARLEAALSRRAP